MHIYPEILRKAGESLMRSVRDAWWPHFEGRVLSNLGPSPSPDFSFSRMKRSPFVGVDLFRLRWRPGRSHDHGLCYTVFRGLGRGRI